MSRLVVTVAGAVTLQCGEDRVGDRGFAARQLRLVTCMLVLERATAVPVEVLAGELWPDSPPAQWRAAVRVLVSQVRDRLAEVGRDRGAIVSRAGAYVVQLDPVTVDVEQAVAGVATARTALERGNAVAAAHAAGAARSVLSRPILSGVDTPWVDDLHHRMTRQHLDSLVLLGRARVELGKPDQARTVLTEALERDPLREDGWRILMRAEVAAGNVARALAAYERCRVHLADHLGIDPSAATQHVHGDILQAVPDAAITSAAVPPVEATEPAVVDREPYVGLRAFRTEDADRFFGRDAEVQAVVDRLGRHGIVAVVGPSGVGKSSLVRAGLLPALDRGAIPDADTWVTTLVTPGSTPLKALATAVAAVAGDLDDDHAGDLLASGDDGLARLATHVLGRSASSRLLVVVDQFEELFTLADIDRAEAFARLLEVATAGPAAAVNVVVTLRADFYDRAAGVAGVADLLSTSQFVVPPLAGDQVEDVVVGPARLAGAQLEPGLLGRIVTDVANEPGALPLLQHLLFELWRRRVGRVLTRGAYDDLGGVAGALTRRAEDVFTGLGREDRAIARRVLLRGVLPDEDGADTRRPVAWGELVGPGDDADRVGSVVARLVDARLVTSGRDAFVGAPTVELAHEALIDAWPRLRGWVDEARQWLLAHRRLTAAADNWAGHDRDDDWLVTGRHLDEAHELLLADGRGDVDLRLSPREHDLVDASLTAREHDRAEDAERRARERRLERRSLRRLRALVAVGLVVALGAGTLWWTDRTTARVAGARALAAASREALATDPQRALLLGLAARDRAGTGTDPVHHEIANSLHAAIAANRVIDQSTAIPAPMDFTVDRRFLVARRVEAEPDGSWAVEVREVETGDLVEVLAGHGGAGSIADAKFSGDGRRLAVEDSVGVVTTWDWRAGTRWRVEDTNADAGGWVDLSADGRYVVRTNRTDPPNATPIEVWDVEAESLVAAFGGEPAPGARPIDPPWPPSGHFHPSDPRIALLHVATDVVEVADVEAGRSAWRSTTPGLVWAGWSPDGRWLAVVADRFVLLDGATGEQVADIDRTGEPSPVEWSLDSRQVSIGSSPRNPGPVRVWTVVDDAGPIPVPDPPLELRADPLPCALGVFGPGDTLWEASPCGGGLRRWDLATNATAEVAWLPGDGWASSPLAFDPDGTRLAVSGEDGRLTLYDTVTWEVDRQVDAHDPPGVVDLDFSADGSVLASRGLDGVVLWDAAMWEAVVRRYAPDWGRVAVNPDGELVAWSSVGRTVGVDLDGRELEDGPTDELVWVMDRSGREVAAGGWGDGLEVQTLDFSPDGRLLAVAVTDSRGSDSPDNGTILWDWRADNVVGLVDTGEEAAAADVDPTGTRLLVTAGPPTSTAEVWDLSSALDGTTAAGLPSDAVERDVVFEGHEQNVRDARFSPDGTAVATCGRDGTARLWDARTGRQLQWLVTDDLADGCTVAFSPDGRMVAVSDPATGTWVFAVHLDDVAAIAEQRVVRGFTETECRDLLDLPACPA